MKHPIFPTLTILLLFTLAQLIGLFIVANSPVVSTNEPANSFAFLYIIIGVLIGTAIAFTLIKFKKFKLLKSWTFLAFFIGLTFAFSSFLAFSLAVVLSIALITWRILRPNFFSHNIPELFVYSGFTLVFLELVSVLTTIILLLLISVYDIIAVWKTKHMITLAKSLMENRNFTGFTFSYPSSSIIRRSPKTKKRNKRKEHHQAVLGGGDIFFPLLFASTVSVQYTPIHALFIVAGALFGLFILFSISKQGKFYPAMPFIAAGCLLGFGLSFLL